MGTKEKPPQRKTGGYVKGKRGRQKVHGMKGTKTHNSWRSMIARCYTPSYQLKQWKDYGGRGIKVCERWWNFENFLADMGERPEGTTLDRFPNHDGNYEPGNCRWASNVQQGNNKRDNVILTARGETLTICEWAAKEAVPRQRIYRRVFSYGWTPEAAIFTPQLSRRRPCQRA